MPHEKHSHGDPGKQEPAGNMEHGNHGTAGNVDHGAQGGSGPTEPASGLLEFTVWDASLLALLVGAFAIYFFVGRRGGRLSGKTTLAWGVGLTVLFMAAFSPFASLREGSHLGYMMQLELMMTFSPLLILLGLRPMLGLLSDRRWFLRLASLPALTVSVWVLTLYFWHIPAIHMAGMHSGGLYPLQILSYLIVGLLFWLPVICDEDPKVGMRPLGKLGYLALAQAGAGLLAAILIWYPEVIYAHGAATQPFGLSALLDQRLSGVIMMVFDMMVASTVAGWVVLRALADDRGWPEMPLADKPGAAG
ncbi:cytochrome c oxidase assembly protein [soil metagenome]